MNGCAKARGANKTNASIAISRFMADSSARAVLGSLANHLDLKRLNMKVAPGVSAVNAKNHPVAQPFKG